MAWGKKTPPGMAAEDEICLKRGWAQGMVWSNDIIFRYVYIHVTLKVLKIGQILGTGELDRRYSRYSNAFDVDTPSAVGY